jgi:hypothetical protein
MTKNNSTFFAIIVVILAVLAIAITQPGGFKNLSGSVTAVGITGTFAEAGTIECTPSATAVSFGTVSPGATVLSSPAITFTSQATSTTLDVTGQMTNFATWLFQTESANWVIKHALVANAFNVQNIGYSGGAVVTNTLAKAATPAPALATEPLLFSMTAPTNAVAKVYTGTYTVTCAANAANMNGVNVQIVDLPAGTPHVGPLVPSTNYGAVLTNALTGGTAVTTITSFAIADSAGNIAPQTITPGACLGPFGASNLCGKFPYSRGSLIPLSTAYGKAVGTGSANLATAVVQTTA